MALLVSIHAPREGCDLDASLRCPTIGCFNSRTPGGVRPELDRLKQMTPIVSIHAPREGCDDMLGYGFEITLFQFTHPGRGATIRLLLRLALTVCFNSRTPGGVRPIVKPLQPTEFRFNSRTPGGVRRHFWILVSSPSMFQFTHPGRGATQCHIVPKEQHPCFNSRTPGGVRPSTP